MRKFLLSAVLAAFSVSANAQVVPFGTLGGGGTATSNGTVISGCTAYSLVYIDSLGALRCAQAAQNSNVSTAGNAITQINATISGSSATSNFLNITGTFPGTLSAATSAIYATIAFDDDSRQQAVVRAVATGSGATANITAAVWGENGATGQGSTAGYFVASGNASSSTAVRGEANAGTYRVGGYFTLGTLSLPNASAALMIDNGVVAANIFEARDNQTAVFTITDGGQITGTGKYSGPDTGFGFTSQSSSGLSRSNTNAVTQICESLSTICIGLDSSNILKMGSSAQIGFQSGTYNTTGLPDAFFARDGAAAIQLGADVNGAPTNQTLKAHDGITGTDRIGANLTLASGNGTGAGAGSQLNLNAPIALATGTTAQTSQNRVTVCETKILSNTSATTTTLATIGAASNTLGGGEVHISVMANNGTTDFAGETQSATFSWTNKAGTFTVSTPTITASSASASAGAGSATIGFTLTGASSLISLKVTPVFTTIAPTLVTAYIEVINHGPGAVLCQ